MPLAVDLQIIATSTVSAVTAKGIQQFARSPPQAKKLRHSLEVRSEELNLLGESQHFHRGVRNKSYKNNINRNHRQTPLSACGATMQGYRGPPSFVVDFDQSTGQPTQTQAFTPYLPVCYAPVCCAPPMTTGAHVPVNRWAAFPAAPCNCTSGLQVLTSCDGVACTASHGTMPVPFIHFHGVSMPYHCPHFHTHRLPQPTQAPVAAVPVSFSSSVYQAPTLQPGVYHHQQQQHRLQAQAQVSYHNGHQLPSQQQQQQQNYHGHQTAQMSAAYHGGHQVPVQQNAGFHGHQQPPNVPQQQQSYHSHQMPSQASVYHQPTHFMPAAIPHSAQMSDELVSDNGVQPMSSVVHQSHQQQQNHQQSTPSATAVAGQPLQHAGPNIGQAPQMSHATTVNMPPSWLLPMPNNEFLAAQVPQYRPASSARQRWRTYPPVATPYSGYLLHFLAMLGRPAVMSTTLPHHRVGLQTEDINDLDSYEALLSLAERLGDAKSRGLSKLDIEKLPCYRYESLMAADDMVDESSARLDQTSCVVCLCDFELRQMVRILPCRHEFHARCVDKWLKTNRTCPLCRADVTETTKMDVE